VQSLLVRQATHRFVMVSQAGAPGVMHCEELVHPARQVPKASHTGVVPLQSEFDEHCTQALFRQRGVLPEQFESDSHCTHVCELESQTLRWVGQSLDVTHPTHAPVLVSHSSPLRHGAAPSTSHEG
jgi:hypothetical protein